jgi:PASTA domain
MPDVHVPGMGNVPRKGLIAGLIVGAVGIGYFYIKHKESASTATASTASPNAYGYGYGGYGYGSYGYNNPAFNEPYIGGEYGYGGLYGYGIGEGYGVGSSTAPAAVVTTNAAWAQAAENYLTSQGGYDAGTVAAALGIYITGSTLSTAQQAIVEAAIAFEGYPPDAGANGYPPAMHTSAATGQGGGSGTGTGTGTGTGSGTKNITVPNVQGKRLLTGVAQLKAAGLKTHNSGFSAKSLNYIVSQTPGAGTKVASGTTVDLGLSQTKPK